MNSYNMNWHKDVIKIMQLLMGHLLAQAFQGTKSAMPLYWNLDLSHFPLSIAGHMKTQHCIWPALL